MQKVLFIDRDGTIIVEPPTDFQIDSLEKLEFLPKALSNLRKLSEETDYELVMVTNQDGLGTDSFPEETFWPAHLKMMKTLEGENIHFENVCVDRTFEHENAPTRKPRTGLLIKYLEGDYDLENSFVLGDRLSDMQLAVNLGAKGILILDETPEEISGEQRNVTDLVTTDWDSIYEFLKLPARKATVKRTTKETEISVELNLDGTGQANMQTGLGFFDHMLDQLAKHSGADIAISVKGDLHIDEHHTIEDTALALGEAFLIALGDKRGTNRYGFLLPMDGAAQVAMISASAVDGLGKQREKIGEMPTEMFMHFFKSFSDTSKCNLNIKCEGDNEHHKIEAIFKAWAKAIKMAVKRNVKAMNDLPSTKGVL
jgi:imidazoleglycerol-phosphate dehydratase/histidinol-phosphatase